MQHCVHRVLRNRNPVPGVGRVLGEEEVMFGKGNEMIPLVRDWRELCKGVLGVDSQGEEGKGSEVGAISAPPCYGHSFPQDIPRKRVQSALSFPRGGPPAPIRIPYSLFALSPPVLHITSARILPLPLPSCSGC